MMVVVADDYHRQCYVAVVTITVFVYSTMTWDAVVILVSLTWELALVARATRCFAPSAMLILMLLFDEYLSRIR